MIGLLAAVGAIQFVQELGEKQLCAVGSAAKVEESRELLQAVVAKGREAMGDKAYFEEDSDAIYVFSRSDPTIAQYETQARFCEALRERLMSGQRLELTDLGAEMEEYLLARFDGSGAIRKRGDRIGIGVVVSERYVLRSGGRQIRGTLSKELQAPVPLNRVTIDPDGGAVTPRSNPTRPNVLEYTTVSPDLVFIRQGPVINTKSHAVLSERAFKFYAELVESLDERAKAARAAFFADVFSREKTGFDPLPYTPKDGSQLDEERRRALLRYGISRNNRGDIDEAWIRNADIDDHYYSIEFNVRFESNDGLMPNVFGVAFSFRMFP